MALLLHPDREFCFAPHRVADAGSGTDGLIEARTLIEEPRPRSHVRSPDERGGEWTFGAILIGERIRDVLWDGLQHPRLGRALPAWLDGATEDVEARLQVRATTQLNEPVGGGHRVVVGEYDEIAFAPGERGVQRHVLAARGHVQRRER